MRRNELVKILDRLEILLYFLSTMLIPLLQTRTLGNCKTRALVSHLSSSLIKKEKSNRKEEKDAPDTGTPQLRKKFGGFVQVLTRDKLLITSRDKKEVWLPVSER